MDGFRNAPMPADYREIQWLVNIFITGMGIGWIINYGLMIWHSRESKTYSMAIIPLCNNIGWEMVYTLVYPSPNRVELAVFAGGVTLNVFIMITAAQSAKTEWSHSPLVSNNTALIFIVGTLVCFTGHVALAKEIGPGLGYSWGAAICQLVLSIGGLCQLLQRNSRRGGSWALWASRFIGSCCTVGFAYLRWKYWPELYSWLGNPLVLWCLGTFFLAEVTYGICYYRLSPSRMNYKEE
ncbi:hypothetical protein GQ53DRAFT_637206 [Thozetella sp. PMI_491]|nr:hypothetical protein GQ53DRAFT_637206 [Thozetella sp. PMI_491]